MPTAVDETLYMRMDDLAIRLCYRGPNRARSAYQWARKHDLPMYWRGRHRLVREDDMVEALATGRCIKGQARFVREAQAK